MLIISHFLNLFSFKNIVILTACVRPRLKKVSLKCLLVALMRIDDRSYWFHKIFYLFTALYTCKFHILHDFLFSSMKDYWKLWIMIIKNNEFNTPKQHISVKSVLIPIFSTLAPQIMFYMWYGSCITTCLPNLYIKYGKKKEFTELVCVHNYS
jgi:hypothetical protein